MKVIFVALCLVAGAFARSAVPPQQTFAEGPECPIDDPLLRDGPVPLNVSVNPIVELALGSELTDLKVDGLSTLHYKVDINALLLTATFNVTLENVRGNATYKAEGYVDARPLRPETLPSGNLTGSGLGKVSATKVHLKGRATLSSASPGTLEPSSPSEGSSPTGRSSTPTSRRTLTRTGPARRTPSPTSSAWPPTGSWGNTLLRSLSTSLLEEAGEGENPDAKSQRRPNFFFSSFGL